MKIVNVSDCVEFLMFLSVSLVAVVIGIIKFSVSGILLISAGVALFSLYCYHTGIKLEQDNNI